MRTLAALMLWSSFASAACLNGDPTISEEYSNSVLVLVGKVVAKRAAPASADGYFLEGDTYSLSPLRVLKGTASSRVDLFSENSSGRFPMQLGREYLLFVDEFHGRLMVDNCGNSEVMQRAKNALARTVAASAALRADSQAALNSLRNANPAARWIVSSANTADFDCDGKADTVMLGAEKGKAMVGVVWGSPKKRPTILTFPTGTSAQDGFSGPGKTIETFPLDCKDGQGRMLPGCQITPACREFFVSDGDTDPFHFYWDSSRGSLRWWRE